MKELNLALGVVACVDQLHISFTPLSPTLLKVLPLRLHHVHIHHRPNHKVTLDPQDGCGKEEGCGNPFDSKGKPHIVASRRQVTVLVRATNGQVAY